MTAPKQNTQLVLLTMVLTLSSLGCGGSDPGGLFGGDLDNYKDIRTGRGIDQAFRPYTEAFEAELSVAIGDIPLSFVSSLAQLAIGACRIYDAESRGLSGKKQSKEAYREIYILEAAWAMLGPLQRQALIWHELGHCVLDLEHDDRTVFAAVADFTTVEHGKGKGNFVMDPLRNAYREEMVAWLTRNIEENIELTDDDRVLLYLDGGWNVRWAERPYSIMNSSLSALEWERDLHEHYFALIKGETSPIGLSAPVKGKPAPRLHRDLTDILPLAKRIEDALAFKAGIEDQSIFSDYNPPISSEELELPEPAWQGGATFSVSLIRGGCRFNSSPAPSLP